MIAPKMDEKKKPERCDICSMLTRYWEMFPVGQSDLRLCRLCLRDELEHVAEYQKYLDEIKSQK